MTLYSVVWWTRGERLRTDDVFSAECMSSCGLGQGHWLLDGNGVRIAPMEIFDLAVYCMERSEGSPSLGPMNQSGEVEVRQRVVPAVEVMKSVRSHVGSRNFLCEYLLITTGITTPVPGVESLLHNLREDVSGYIAECIVPNTAKLDELLDRFLPSAELLYYIMNDINDQHILEGIAARNVTISFHILEYAALSAREDLRFDSAKVVAASQEEFARLVHEVMYQCWWNSVGECMCKHNDECKEWTPQLRERLTRKVYSLNLQQGSCTVTSRNGYEFVRIVRFVPEAIVSALERIYGKRQTMNF